MATKHIVYNASGAGSGASFADPWTLAQGNAGLTAGDIGRLYAGTFSHYIDAANAGTSGSVITYEKNSGDSPVIAGQTGVDNLCRFDTNYVTVDGMTFTTPEDKSALSFFVRFGGSANCSLTNFSITGQANWANMYNTGMGGISVTSGANNITIQSGTLNSIAHQAISGPGSGGSNRMNVSSVTCTNTGKNGVMCGGSETTYQDKRVYVTNFTVDYSETSDGVQINGSHTSPTYRYVYLTDCVFKNCAENGFDGKGSSHVLIQNSFMYGMDGNDTGNGNTRYGPAIGIGSGRVGEEWIARFNVIYDNCKGMTTKYVINHIHYHNNTVLNNNHDFNGANSTNTVSDTSNSAFYGVGNGGTTGLSGIKNNIIGYHRNFEIGLDTSASNTTDYNLYLNTSGTPEFLYNNVAHTFASWQSTSGKDATSVASATSPFSTSLATVNGSQAASVFDITAASQADGTGTYLTQANGAGTDSVSLIVDDARYFTWGYGITGLAGDTITVGSTQAIISSINYTTNTITLATAISWSDNANIYYGTDTTPNKGARGITSADVTAPTTPGTPTAASITATSQTINWTASTDAVGVTYYSLERKLTTNGTWAVIGSPPSNTFADSNLAANTSYDYRVRAYDAAGNVSSYSSTGTLPTSTPSDSTAPTFSGALTAIYSEDIDTVSLSWNQGTDAVTAAAALVYNIYRTRSTGKYSYATPYFSATGVGSTSFPNPGGGKSYFVVRCKDVAGNEDTNTAEVSVTCNRTTSYRAHL